MRTVDVELSPKLLGYLDNLVSDGVAPNRAAVMRLALERLAESEAVNAILQSEKEITVRSVLRGDLRSLLKDTDD